MTEADRIDLAKRIADWKTGRGPEVPLEEIRLAVASIRVARMAFVTENIKAERAPRAPSPGRAKIEPISFKDMGFE